MRIQRQRTRDAAAQRVVQDEVHRPQLRQQVALPAANGTTAWTGLLG